MKIAPLHTRYFCYNSCHFEIIYFFDVVVFTSLNYACYRHSALALFWIVVVYFVLVLMTLSVNAPVSVLYIQKDFVKIQDAIQLSSRFFIFYVFLFTLIYLERFFICFLEVGG